jgi:hypothetical protein
VFGNLERYKDKLVLRPQEISNHPEVVRRLGIIGSTPRWSSTSTATSTPPTSAARG